MTEEIVEKTITVTYKLKYYKGHNPQPYDDILCLTTAKIIRTGVEAIPVTKGD
jgi:hypothetical protein